MSVKDLLASGIASNGLVEPMVWVYVEDIDHFVDGDTWRTYSAVFAHLWTASAFKGAFGERLFMPNLHRHYRFFTTVINNFLWVFTLAINPPPPNTHTNMLKRVIQSMISDWCCKILKLGHTEILTVTSVIGTINRS